MDVVATAAVLALLLALAIAASPPLLAAWGRATGRQHELEMWRAMRRRGLATDEASVAPEQVARAIRRCQLCPSVEHCREWLASSRTDGMDEFCPNDRFFQSLRGAPHR